MLIWKGPGVLGMPGKVQDVEPGDPIPEGVDPERIARLKKAGKIEEKKAASKKKK